MAKSCVGVCGGGGSRSGCEAGRRFWGSCDFPSTPKLQPEPTLNMLPSLRVSMLGFNFLVLREKG